MESNRETIRRLQHLLRDQFGSEQDFSGRSAPRQGVALSDGELERGRICEVIARPAEGGAGLLREKMVRTNLGPDEAFVLIDGRDTFDPQSSPHWLRRMLWVRCRQAEEVMKAADWLIRDGNLSLVMADLQFNPVSELRRLPPSSWYRLRALAEANATRFAVFVPERTLPCAHRRCRVREGLSLASLDEIRETLAAGAEWEREEAGRCSE